MNRNKVRGMIVGGAIGDAWGMPVETWTPEKIAKTYPEGITRFLTPKDHKWFDPEKTPAGSTTDDTQLKVATMRGFISGHAEAQLEEKPDLFGYYMHCIGKAHCDAMRQTTDGWGHTTRDAVRRLNNGVHWSESGKTTEPNRGTGNGVPMKCSPFAAWYASPVSLNGDPNFNFNQWCVAYSAMTHYSKMSAFATVCHCHAMSICLQTLPSHIDYTLPRMLEVVSDWVWECSEGKQDQRDNFDVSHLNDAPDNLEDRMLLLYKLRDDLPSMSQTDIIQNFGNGSCYVYESLPFSYAWFVKNPHSFQILQQVVEAGGDTDTNASIVGEMLGALHGFEALKTHLPWAIEGLVGINDLLSITDKFCDTLGIKD